MRCYLELKVETFHHCELIRPFQVCSTGWWHRYVTRFIEDTVVAYMPQLEWLFASITIPGQATTVDSLLTHSSRWMAWAMGYGGLWVMREHFWCKMTIWFPKKVWVMRPWGVMGYERYGLRGSWLYNGPFRKKVSARVLKYQAPLGCKRLPTAIKVGLWCPNGDFY